MAYTLHTFHGFPKIQESNAQILNEKFSKEPSENHRIDFL